MLRGEKIVFTGRLDTLSRKQAQALVTALGGKPQAAVTKDTTILVVGLTTDKIFDHSRDNSKAELELLRSRKGNTQKQNKNATEVKFEPENRPSTPLPSIQRVLNDDVEKWCAEKDYERLRQKIAHEQAQREL